MIKKVLVVGATTSLAPLKETAIESIKEMGINVVFVNKETGIRDEFPVHAVPPIYPIMPYEYDDGISYCSKHQRDDVYREKRIAKRRKRNKNVKTHRRR